jgi:hypothetical protein
MTTPDLARRTPQVAQPSAPHPQAESPPSPTPRSRTDHEERMELMWATERGEIPQLS